MKNMKDKIRDKELFIEQSKNKKWYYLGVTDGDGESFMSYSFYQLERIKDLIEELLEKESQEIMKRTTNE